MTLPDSFNQKLAAFKDHQAQPWGQMRYTLTAANLARHINGTNLNILDAGGGNGVEAIAFAQQGHQVTLVDYSAEMLAEARRSAESNGVSDRLTFHQSDLTAIPQLFPQPTFDLILCHHVLQYVDDLNAAVHALSRVVKPNGLLSIMCINRYSEPYRLALQELNLPAAYAALGAEVIVTKIFETTMKAYAAEDLREPLEHAGCTIVGQYGIRCVNDYIANNDLKSDPVFFADLLKLELALSDKFPYYLSARAFHLVAQKNVE